MNVAAVVFLCVLFIPSRARARLSVCVFTFVLVYNRLLSIVLSSCDVCGRAIRASAFVISKKSCRDGTKTGPLSLTRALAPFYYVVNYTE